MTRLLLPLLPVLLFAPACAAYDDGSLELLMDTGVGEGAGGGDESDEDQTVPTALLECELPQPCELPFEGMLLEADGAKATYSESDLCVFRALAGGEPALVQTTAVFSDSVAYLDYAVEGPGVALRQASGVNATSGRWHKDVFRCELQAPAFFAACAETPAGACLDPEMWVVGCIPLDILVCPE